MIALFSSILNLFYYSPFFYYFFELILKNSISSWLLYRLSRRSSYFRNLFYFIRADLSLRGVCAPVRRAEESNCSDNCFRCPPKALFFRAASFSCLLTVSAAFLASFSFNRWLLSSQISKSSSILKWSSSSWSHSLLLMKDKAYY